jgi:hypothetical protein
MLELACHIQKEEADLAAMTRRIRQEQRLQQELIVVVVLLSVKAARLRRSV